MSFWSYLPIILNNQILPAMKKFIMLLLLISPNVLIEAQQNQPIDTVYNFGEYSHLEMIIGGSYLFNKDINEDFDWGLYGNFRFSFELKNRKLSLFPLFGFRSYSVKLKDNSSVSNNLTIMRQRNLDQNTKQEYSLHISFVYFKHR